MLNTPSPIERYLCLRSGLEKAFSLLDEFDSEISKIYADPFVEAPSQEILVALNHVRSGRSCIFSAMHTFQQLGDKMGIENGDRTSLGLTIDESLS